MEVLITRILITSVALTMLVSTEGVLACNALDVTFGQQDRGTAFDAQGTDQGGINGPRVRVQPGDADLSPGAAQDEKQMEPELNAIAKDIEKVENKICRGC